MNCWCGADTAMWQGVITCTGSQYHDPTATGRPTEINRLYISGPMSNLPECNYPEFNRVADKLRPHYGVVNPAEFGADNSHYVDLLRDDLTELLKCDGVALLDNWWESAGSRLEVHIAGHLMMPVKPWAEWL